MREIRPGHHLQNQGATHGRKVSRHHLRSVARFSVRSTIFRKCFAIPMDNLIFPSFWNDHGLIAVTQMTGISAGRMNRGRNEFSVFPFDVHGEITARAQAFNRTIRPLDRQRGQQVDFAVLGLQQHFAHGGGDAEVAVQSASADAGRKDSGRCCESEKNCCSISMRVLAVMQAARKARCATQTTIRARRCPEKSPRASRETFAAAASAGVLVDADLPARKNREQMRRVAMMIVGRVEFGLRWIVLFSVIHSSNCPQLPMPGVTSLSRIAAILSR